MKIGERIREARKAKGWSQSKLGEELGVSQQMVAQYEKGDRTPKKETVEKIADALDVIPLQLMDFKQTFNIPDVDSAFYDFSSEETQQFIELVRDYKKLNDEGKNKVVEFANDLTHVEKYRNNSEQELEQLQVSLTDPDSDKNVAE